MKRTAASLGISTILLAVCCRVAAAEPADATLVSAPDRAHYAFGARVGGYGFRNTEDPTAGKWDDCPMEGFGVFAQRSLTRHFFAEAGFDLYTAREGTPTEEMPLVAMDRISGITTVAAGARMPWRWVSPYVQLGVGLEVTRVEMWGHDHAERGVLPMGFVGLGAELRPTENVSLGANVRTNVMKHFDHGEGSGEEMTGEYEAAAQGQLFVKLEI